MTIVRGQCSLGRGVRCALACPGLACVLLGVLWYDARAEQPRPSKNPSDLAGYDALITAEDRGHWAFQAVTSSTIPTVKNTTWARNPIDRFILAKQEEQGLTPAPEADPRALVRRLYLDLTGLPPTPDECAAFLEEYSEDGRRGRKARRQPARPSRLWRTLGAALARPGAIRRV